MISTLGGWAQVSASERNLRQSTEGRLKGVESLFCILEGSRLVLNTLELVYQKTGIAGGALSLAEGCAHLRSFALIRRGC